MAGLKTTGLNLKKKAGWRSLFRDYFFIPEEKEKSLFIFNEGMINELNFFRDACDETLLLLVFQYLMSLFISFYSLSFRVVG